MQRPHVPHSAINNRPSNPTTNFQMQQQPPRAQPSIRFASSSPTTNRSTVFLILGFLLGCFVTYVVTTSSNSNGSQFSSAASSSISLITAGSFRDAPVYRNPLQTLGSTLLMESPWMRVESHDIRPFEALAGSARDQQEHQHQQAGNQTNNKKKGEAVITDWKWIDVKDHMNVLPAISLPTAARYWRPQNKNKHDGTGDFTSHSEHPIDNLQVSPLAKRLIAFHDLKPVECNRPEAVQSDLERLGMKRAEASRIVSSTCARKLEARAAADKDEEEEDLYIVFVQKKYAFLAESIAVVGGLMDRRKDKTLHDTAKRELLEELDMVCDEWHQVGGSPLRTDANRGCGACGTFLPRRCHKRVEWETSVVSEEVERGNQKARLAEADLEDQKGYLVTATDLAHFVFASERSAVGVTGGSDLFFDGDAALSQSDADKLSVPGARSLLAEKWYLRRIRALPVSDEKKQRAPFPLWPSMSLINDRDSEKPHAEQHNHQLEVDRQMNEALRELAMNRPQILEVKWMKTIGLCLARRFAH